MNISDKVVTNPERLKPCLLINLSAFGDSLKFRA